MIPPGSPETLAELGSGTGRFKRGFRQLRNAPCSWMLIRILIIIQLVPFLWDLIAPAQPGVLAKLPQAQAILGLKKDLFLSGDFWQLTSHALIHATWPHLLLNATAILLLGSKIEHIAGKKTFWLLSLTAATFGGALFLIISPHGASFSGQQTLVGSSAIVFAFLLLLTTLSPESRFLPLFLSGKSLGAALILANLILALSHPHLPTGPFARFGRHLTTHGFADLFLVSHTCHLGGSIAGYLFGKYLLRPRVSLASLKRERQKRETSSKR